MAAVAVVLAALTLPAVLDPPDWQPTQTDAVFIHVGGRGERLETALDLMQSGVAPVLVIATAPSSEWPPARALCDHPAPFEVICLDWVPQDTKDEARVLAELADSEGWTSAAVVTSDYHVARATMLDRSCTSISIVPAPAPSNLSPALRAEKVVHEMAGIPLGWMFQRCRR